MTVAVSAVVVAGCGGQKVEMSFADAHTQFNEQVFGGMIAAQDAILSFGYHDAVEKISLDLNSMQAEGDITIDTAIKGSNEAMEGTINLALNGSENTSQMTLKANLDMLMKIVDGTMYVEIEDSLVDMGENNPASAMIDATLKELSNKWIAIDPDAIMSVLGQPGGQNPLDPRTIKASTDFVVDMQRLFSDNNLFVQKGDERTEGNKVAYDVALNIDGIKNIVDGVISHEYIADSMKANGQEMTEEDKNQLLSQLPLILASIEVDAFLKVNAKNNVELVINRIGTPEGKDGLVDSSINAKKAHFQVVDEEGSVVFVGDVKGKNFEGTLSDNGMDVATIDAAFSTKVSDKKVSYDIDGDLKVFAIPFVATEDNPLVLEFSMEKTVKKIDEVVVTAPEESQPIIEILETL